MKRILNVLIIVAILTSCDNVNKKATSDSTVVKPDIELIDNKEYLFNLDDFTVSSNYLFELEIKKDTINSYKYLDEVNNTFYRINVVDNRKASSLLTDESNSGIIDVVKEFQSNFLEEYKRNLKLNKQSYKEVLFNNRKAIKVNIILTNDNLIETKQGFTNALMLVFLNGFKSYTLTVISSPDIIEEQFNMFIDSFKLTKDKNQNIYISKKYNYQFNIPDGYEMESSKNKNIDLKIFNKNGSVILINISPRTTEEYGITAHDYTREYLAEVFRQYAPYHTITRAEKTDIDNINAFLINYVDKKNATKSIEIYFYKQDYAIVLTATCSESDFNNEEPNLLSTLRSFCFN